MQWLDDFDFVLFDLDGLLIDSEKLHFQAYKKLCLSKGADFNWSFNKFCLLSHTSATKIKETLYEEFPLLTQYEWPLLYAEKKSIYETILKVEKLDLMPGVATLLKSLKKPSCVVTNSPRNQVEFIRAKEPLLQLLPNWITREDYKEPKPNSECYLKAIKLFAQEKGKIIGFEDTVKGIKALKIANVKRVLICAKTHPQMNENLDKDILHFTSFETIGASE